MYSEDILQRIPEGLLLKGNKGEYKLESKIGEGGMGVVYKAQSVEKPSLVAIKLILAKS